MERSCEGRDPRRARPTRRRPARHPSAKEDADRINVPKSFGPRRPDRGASSARKRCDSTGRSSGSTGHFPGGVRQGREEELNRSESGTATETRQHATRSNHGALCESWLLEYKHGGSAPAPPAPAGNARRQTGVHFRGTFSAFQGDASGVMDDCPRFAASSPHVPVVHPFTSQELTRVTGGAILRDPILSSGAERGAVVRGLPQEPRPWPTLERRRGIRARWRHRRSP